MVRVVGAAIVKDQVVIDGFLGIGKLENRFIHEHLLDVPIRIAQGEVHHADVLTNTSHFLCKPQREGVVIAVREEDGIRAAAVEEVVGIIPGNPEAGTVMFLVVRNARDKKRNKYKSGSNRRSEGGRSCGRRGKQHENTSANTINHAHEDKCRRVEVVTFTDFHVDRFRERSALSKTGEAFFNLLPVSPGRRIFGIANLLFEFSNSGCRSVTHAKTFNRKLGIINRLAEVDEFVRIRKRGNASTGIVQIRHVASHGANPIVTVALFHASAIGKVDIEQEAKRAKGVKRRDKDSEMLVTLIDINAGSNNKTVKQQEEEKLHKGVVAHKRHLRRELEAQTLDRFIFRSVKCIDAVSVVHPTDLCRQVLGHLVTTIAHAREGEHLVGNAGTAIESTGNHAFGTVLLTFDEVIEGDPVFVLEQVAKLEVALFVTDVEFRIVFINRRVEFRTDRDVKVGAIADQSKERKSERKKEATLKTSFTTPEYTLANASITQTSNN